MGEVLPIVLKEPYEHPIRGRGNILSEFTVENDRQVTSFAVQKYLKIVKLVSIRRRVITNVSLNLIP
jgi:hypothetical protein